MNTLRDIWSMTIFICFVMPGVCFQEFGLLVGGRYMRSQIRPQIISWNIGRSLTQTRTRPAAKSHVKSKSKRKRKKRR